MPEQHLLGPFVRRFLVEELIVDRNLSSNTQSSYRDAIRVLLAFIAERYAIEPTRVTVERVDAKLLRSFLFYLENERGNATATRNQRLAALHSLFRFIARRVPELVDHASQIQSIPPRRTVTPTMPYLEKHEIDSVLAAPDRKRPLGRRDYALLLFLYNTGARASEAAAVSIGDLSIDEVLSVRIVGKGRKIRHCPLWMHTAVELRSLLGPRIDGPGDTPLFINVRGQRITRYGIHTLVERAVAKATQSTPSLTGKRISPHTIRHTTAVHLLRANVDINTIRAWLGHVSLETTNRYAEIDLESKAKALASCAVEDSTDGVDRVPLWKSDDGMMSFLDSL